MRSQLLLALAAAGWLITANTPFAEEVGTGNQAEASQTATSGGAESTEDSMVDDVLVPQRPRGGGNVEWRRNDNKNERPQPTGKSGKSGSGGSGSGSGGGPIN